MSLSQYLWVVIKETTKAERAAGVGALVAIVISILLIIYIALFLFNTKMGTGDDVAPHEWNITRKMWLAKEVDVSNSSLLFSPVDLVIIQHTVSPECHDFVTCAAELRQLQDYFISNLHYGDIAYNFLVGNDGRVYEGRGWGVIGAHTFKYNSCSLGIGFIGDYREENNVHTRVSPAQIESTRKLLDHGVRLGYIFSDYRVLGAKDLHATASPGSNLYREILSWQHYDHLKQYKNKTCIEIRLIITNKYNND